MVRLQPMSVEESLHGPGAPARHAERTRPSCRAEPELSAEGKGCRFVKEFAPQIPVASLSRIPLCQASNCPARLEFSNKYAGNNAYGYCKDTALHRHFHGIC